MAKVRGEEVKVKALVDYAAGRTIERDDEDHHQPPLDFVRDNFGNAGDIAGALVVQSIYNARRARAFQITSSYYWRRTTCGRRFSMLPIARQQQWCDTMNREQSLSALYIAFE